MDMNKNIRDLVAYGMEKNLVDPADKIYVTNRLLELFKLTDYVEDTETPDEIADLLEPETPKAEDVRSLQQILDSMCDFAVEEGIIEDTITNRDLFDTKIMGLITPMPSTVRATFAEKYKYSPKIATDYYYDLSRDTNYIRTERVAKDEKWVTDTRYGKLDMTINLSKPEKDPKDIAAALTAKKSGYPACLLCKENEGYAGTLTHPARQNHRIIPIQLMGENYFLQYSPYVYYNEHCIIFNEKHTPMKIDKSTFYKLLDFTRKFPHYTAGSNADLPIVGGSILTHDHFQGGNYEFPMVRADYEKEYKFKDFPGVKAGVIKWPLTTIRLRGMDSQDLVDLGDKILQAWRNYTDEEAFIFAETDGVKHNTITPIARRRGGEFELDLVLRNNITTEEFPMGVYHPHPEFHHIKKENIGLIEVMGLAILPARLKKEMATVEEVVLAALKSGSDDAGLLASLEANESTKSHAAWAAAWKVIPSIREDIASGVAEEELVAKVHAACQEEMGLTFADILENAGVYKETEVGREALDRFIASIN